jgi:thioredoxin-like negative regulator of GroEL
MNEINITTTSIDISVGLNALQAYQKGDYKNALTHLLDILDIEPKNWQARLYLGVCYHKTNQLAAAQRAFRYMWDNCPEAELKQKACTALHAVNAQINGEQTKAPEEFGRYTQQAGLWKFGDR